MLTSLSNIDPLLPNLFPELGWAGDDIDREIDRIDERLDYMRDYPTYVEAYFFNNPEEVTDLDIADLDVVAAEVLGLFANNFIPGNPGTPLGLAAVLTTEMFAAGEAMLEALDDADPEWDPDFADNCDTYNDDGVVLLGEVDFEEGTVNGAIGELFEAANSVLAGTEAALDLAEGIADDLQLSDAFRLEGIYSALRSLGNYFTQLNNAIVALQAQMQSIGNNINLANEENLTPQQADFIVACYGVVLDGIAAGQAAITAQLNGN